MNWIGWLNFACVFISLSAALYIAKQRGPMWAILINVAAAAFNAAILLLRILK